MRSLVSSHHEPQAPGGEPGTHGPEELAPVALRVLVAEDDAVARETLGELLRVLGHEVVGAVGSGREAVECFLSLQPDVVLLDVHMPGGSGLDAAEEIAARAPGAAVVLISGDRELRLSDREVDATAAYACLSKPATPASLDATLRLAGARGRAERAVRGEARMRKKQLEQRKLVERAKGMLMRRHGCSEEQAYRTLRRTSQDRSTPLVEIARAVLEEEVQPIGSRLRSGARRVRDQRAQPVVREGRMVREQRVEQAELRASQGKGGGDGDGNGAERDMRL